MALTGIEIFKLLPKTNCGDCGVPTCLAFAMNLAAGKAEFQGDIQGRSGGQLVQRCRPAVKLHYQHG